MNNIEFTIITFYQFKKINDLEILRKVLKDFCFFNKIKGSILLAEEGINGSVAGLSKSIELLEKKLQVLGFRKLDLKKSFYKYMPFNRLKIKVKKEIVTFDGNYYDVEHQTAKHIGSQKWNKLIRDENTLVLDVRNDFEYKMGTFKNSVNPKTKSFSEFKRYINYLFNRAEKKNIAIFCTGGIRCEKASSYMLKKGLKNIFQLKGGILKYLEDISCSESLWDGECFVFDNRVSIQNEQKKGTYSLCHGCRYPISKKDTKSKKFELGVTCPRCFDKLSKDKKNKLRERNKQIKISKKRGLYNPYIKITPSDF